MSALAHVVVAFDQHTAFVPSDPFRDPEFHDDSSHRRLGQHTIGHSQRRYSARTLPHHPHSPAASTGISHPEEQVVHDDHRPVDQHHAVRESVAAVGAATCRVSHLKRRRKLRKK